MSGDESDMHLRQRTVAEQRLVMRSAELHSQRLTPGDQRQQHGL